jgi:hypothetical protein
MAALRIRRAEADDGQIHDALGERVEPLAQPFERALERRIETEIGPENRRRGDQLRAVEDGCRPLL